MKNGKRWIARLIFTLLSAAAIGFIFFHSSMSADDSSLESGGVVEWLNALFRGMGIPLELNDHIVRKLAHFTEFAVLGALLSVTVFLYLSKRLRTLLIALPAGLAVAVCDELIQTTSQGRSCQLGDVVIDFCGVLTAALIVQLVLYLIHRHRLKKEGNGNE